MKVGLRQKIEHAITREAIRGLFADDFKVSVFDGEQTTLKYGTDAAAVEAVIFTTDEDQLRVEHRHVAEKGQVLFIHDNDDHDVIADRTTNLELSLKDAFELADKIVDEDPAILARVLAEVGAQRFWPERPERCRVVAATATRRLDKPT